MLFQNCLTMRDINFINAYFDMRTILV